jgi:hypothetical protein
MMANEPTLSPMSSAVALSILSAGVFLLVGLITGVWKYAGIRSSPEAQAPVYVDVAQRASLLYSFAALVLAKLAESSPYSAGITLAAAATPIVFFALAITSYIVHGALRDTDNQLRRPHKLGAGTLPPIAITAFMVALILGEIGGTAVLVWGFVQRVILTK